MDVWIVDEYKNAKYAAPAAGRIQCVHSRVHIQLAYQLVSWWLGGVVVRALDLRSKGRGFEIPAAAY